MLSYLHAFHAGNFADVLKHVVLDRVLAYLVKKDKPLVRVDDDERLINRLLELFDEDKPIILADKLALGLVDASTRKASKDLEYIPKIVEEGTTGAEPETAGAAPPEEAPTEQMCFKI